MLRTKHLQFRLTTTYLYFFTYTELVKGERGLGFSILDYQDPLRPSHTLVVIRSLVPGGVAQQDGRLIPGDRLLFVNDQVRKMTLFMILQ